MDKNSRKGDTNKYRERKMGEPMKTNNANTTYIVMNMWNVVVARLSGLEEATRCARACKGYFIIAG